MFIRSEPFLSRGRPEVNTSRPADAIWIGISDFGISRGRTNAALGEGSQPAASKPSHSFHELRPTCTLSISCGRAQKLQRPVTLTSGHFNSFKSQSGSSAASALLLSSSLCWKLSGIHHCTEPSTFDIPSNRFHGRTPQVSGITVNGINGYMGERDIRELRMVWVAKQSRHE